MYNVSTEYEEQINSSLRNPSFIRVKFGLTDPQAIADSTITDTSATPYSDSSQIKIENNIPFYYETFELNKMLLDGVNKLATESYGDYQGYVSEVLSDDDCNFVIDPVLIVNYPTEFEYAGLTLNFDAIRGEYSSEFNIKCYSGVTVVFDNTYTNFGVEYILEENIPLHDRLEITFLKTSLPNKRLRLGYLGFGLVKTMTDDIVTNTVQSRKVDVLSTVLPKGDFRFTFLDVANEYNPENPSGLYQYLEQLQPVKFEYGYELNSGTIEWILGGYNYTTGEVKTDSSGKIPRVTIKTNNSLAYLTDIYIGGTYNVAGRSLYDLAVDVMSGSLIQYEFDVALQSIMTVAPIPKLAKKECLQLIANAGQCVLDVDRFGKVTILRSFPNGNPTTFKFDFTNMLEAPVIKKYPPLKNVNTSFYQYVVEAVSEQLNESTIDVSIDSQFFLEHDMATGGSLAVDGTLVIIGSPVYYAGGCLVTLNGIGTAIVTGNKIKLNENTLSTLYNENGEDCNVRNELIDRQQSAVDYSAWIGVILSLSNEYSFKNRGYPEIDPVDEVLLDTLYSTNLGVVVTESEITFSGTLKGKTKVLIAE